MTQIKLSDAMLALLKRTAELHPDATLDTAFDELLETNDYAFKTFLIDAGIAPPLPTTCDLIEELEPLMELHGDDAELRPLLEGR